jgi:DNA-binding transcriptional ArsR family regulator
MAGESQWTPAPIQIVSDLGQLTAFGDPDQSRILRILQRREATVSELAASLDLTQQQVEYHLRWLIDLVLVRPVAAGVVLDDAEPSYRATAVMFSLRPDPRDQETISSSVAVSMLDALSHEIMSSVTTWPDQKMNFEGRRARLPLSRVIEFNDRMTELIREYWGDNVHSVDEDPNDPLMALMSVWYRLAE